jgi:four helix bundle protein
MAAIQTYEDLIAWQKAHALVLAVYTVTKLFPKEELFGLTSQLRRASVSITSNIVEGFKRESNSEKVRFYNISESSYEEVHYQLRLAEELHYAETLTLRENAREISKIIAGLIKSIRSKNG